jgi:putative inorganic carbon (hco3(-)) transporter
VPQGTDGSRWIFVSYLALLVWAPVPLGSNRPWAWALLALWVLALALWWLAGRIRGKHAYPEMLGHARPMLWCGLLWVGYVWLQLLPLPIEILQALSPEAARWHIEAAAPGAPGAVPLSLDRYATLEAACKSTAYIAFFALSLILLNSRDRIRYAAYALIASGVLQALYGVLGRFQSLEGVAAGSFANRNHYAAYLVMCLSVGIGVLIANLALEQNRSWKRFFQDLIRWIISPKMALRLGLVAMVIALVLTRSRMGNISFFVSLMAAGTIGLLLAKRATKSMVVLLVSLIAVDVFLIGTYFGAQRVIERIAQTNATAEDRNEVAGWTVNMWKDYPVFGSGLGSFPVVYPRYAGEKAWWTYTHAHNDYVEFGAETGVIGLSLLGLMVLMSFAAALRAHYVRRDPLMRGLSFAAMMGMLALMIHSYVDFGLQIPANALTFMLLLAFSWISLYHARSGASFAPVDVKPEAE